MWMWGHTPHRKAPMPVHKSSHSTYSNTAARTKFGAANAAAGLSGEKWLLKKLSAQFPDAHIWFSVRTPARTGQKRYNSDIDLVVVNGRRVILIDAKRWEAGHVYWSLFGVPMQGWRRMRRNNTPMKPSRNMAMAQSRVAQDLPGAHVTSMVIYTPTKRGLPSRCGGCAGRVVSDRICPATGSMRCRVVSVTPRVEHAGASGARKAVVGTTAP